MSTMADSFTHLPEDDLSAYLDHALDSRRLEQAQAHLSACDHCRDALSDMEAMVHMLRALPDVAPPRSFRILVTRQPSLLERLMSWDMGLRGLAAAAAALFLVFFGTDMMRLATAPTGPTLVSLSRSVESRDVAQPAAAPAPTAAARAANNTTAGAAAPVAPPAADTAAAAPKLEPLNASNVTASAASPLGALSTWTLAAGVLAVVLIATAVTRAVRRAGPS
jgi:hypothetical protein